MNELERFVAWVGLYPSVEEAGKVLDVSEDYIKKIEKGIRPISDSLRFAWLCVGGSPDFPETGIPVTICASCERAFDTPSEWAQHMQTCNQARLNRIADTLGSVAPTAQQPQQISQ